MTSNSTEIIADRDFFNYELEGKRFISFRNVVTYHHWTCRPTLEIKQSTNGMDGMNGGVDGGATIYYVFDCPGLDSFGHAVFESIVFFRHIITLNKYFKDVKILTYNSHKYVKSFLRFFNIPNNIIYGRDIPTTEVDYHTPKNVPDINNRCFFPPVISLNDNEINLEFFGRLVEEFSGYINAVVPFVIPAKIPEYGLVYLPRNKVDNYWLLDRPVNGQEEIEAGVIEMGGSVINTYQLNDFFKQAMIVKNSNIIILDYGSSFLVNCIYLKNKKIIALNNCGYYKNDIEYLPLRVLSKIIHSNNEVVYINKFTISFNEDIYPILMGWL
jgi:hypothetical protein